MSSCKKKQVTCKFAGGCGQVFNVSSDLLDHVAGHMGEEGVVETGQNDKGVEDGTACPKLIFTGLDGAEPLDSSNSGLPATTTPSKDLDIGMENSELFPELNVMMNRYQLEEEAISPNKVINMDQVLQPPNPCLELISPEPLPVLDHVNWPELLQNYPSVTDAMGYEDIVSASMESSEEADGSQESSFITSSFEPSSSNLTRDRYSEDDEEEEESHDDDDDDEEELPRSTSGKDLTRIWLPVRKPAKFTSTYLNHTPDVKYKRSQVPAESRISHTGKQRFRQELVTFVTKEKRAYKAIVTTPRSKPKTSRRTHHQNSNQEVKYYSSEFILKEGLKKKRGITHSLNKPYICPVPGCGKAYKNPNGIKYHAKYGHSAPQEFPCHCGKIYSTRHGLMAHKRTHSQNNNSSGSMEDFYSYSEAEESDEYRNSEML